MLAAAANIWKVLLLKQWFDLGLEELFIGAAGTLNVFELLLLYISRTFVCCDSESAARRLSAALGGKFAQPGWQHFPAERSANF